MTNAPLSLTLYGEGDEIVKELTRSIVPWGVLERAIDIQDQFENVKLDKDGNASNLSRESIKTLTGFVSFVFDDKASVDELNRYAGIGDMVAIYQQIFSMVNEVMERNPTTAPTDPKQELQQVRRGKKRSRK